MKEKFPEARIILMLRNPIERAFSHYLMDLKIDLASGNFSDALQKDESVEMQSWGKNSMYIQTGMYANQVKRFIEEFGMERILIVIYDDFKKDTGGTMQKIYSFLQVDPSFKPDLLGWSA